MLISALTLVPILPARTPPARSGTVDVGSNFSSNIRANIGTDARADVWEELVLVTDERVEVPLPVAALPPELLEALARGVAAAFAPPPPAPSVPGEAVDFLTAGQFAVRLGVSRETVRRLAIADVLPCTVVCRGSRKTTRRYPRRFADDFAASGQDMSDLAEFAARWRARMASAGPARPTVPSGAGGHDRPGRPGPAGRARVPRRRP